MYLGYVDGIRALAVLSVIIYHLNPKLLPGGFSGVDVFFVVSGYVVSLSLDKYKDIGMLSFLSIFYSRRIKRILPALIFCLTVTILLTGIFVPRSFLSADHETTALFAFFGLSNFILASGSNDYFGPIAEYNPFTHTWSLGVEEQFYLIFPFIFIFWTISKKEYFKKLSVTIFSILFVLSLCAAFYFSNTNKLYEYYLIFSRFWQLAAGILLYQFTKSSFEKRFQPYKNLFPSISWLALGLVVVGFMISDEKNFPLPWSFFAVGGTFLLLFSQHYSNKGYVHQFLNTRPMSLIGKMSYSLYLWHWPIIVLFHWTIGLNTLPKYLFALILICFLSAISYYFVEIPIRSSQFISKQTRPAIILSGVACIIVFTLLGGSLFKYREIYTLSIMDDLKDWYPSVYSNAENKGPEVIHQNFNGGLKTHFASTNKDSQRRTIYALGDSHAGAYTRLLSKYSYENNSETILYSYLGCGNTISYPIDTMKRDCQDFLLKSFKDVEANGKPGDILFLSSLKLNRFTEQWFNFDIERQKKIMKSASAEKDRKQAIDDNLSLIEPITNKGIVVIYEAPKPIFKSPPFRCSEWFNQSNPVCKNGLTVGREELLEYRQPIMESINIITQNQKNTYSYDPFSILCPNDECQAIVDDKPLYFDGDHISGYANELIYDDFINYVDSIGGKSELASIHHSAESIPRLE